MPTASPPSPLDIRTALAQGTELTGSRLAAEVLLAHATHHDRVWFYAHPEYELREVEWLHYGRYLHERLKGKPIQYITKRQEFYGREFRVTQAVLIPRPETEVLVEAVLKLCSPGSIVLDIGAGSGAIAVTIALESGSQVIATDISAEALDVARANAEKLEAPVLFVETDLLAPFRDAGMDIVVSNPPYIPEADRESLQAEVRDWEPELALFAGADGMTIFERLIPQSLRVLKPGGVLALEIGFGQEQAVRSLLHRFHDICFLPDLAGIPRVLVCKKP